MDNIINSIYSLIYEMVIAQKHIENQISDKSEQIIFHLIKVLKWQDDLNYNKHCDDLNTWFWYCQKKKINSKRIKPKQYQTWLFDENLAIVSDIDNIIKRDLYKYSKKPHRYSNQSRSF